MQILTLITDRPGDALILQDLFRAYFPGGRLEEGTTSAAGATLTVCRWGHSQGLKLILHLDGREYSHLEPWPQGDFLEDETNRTRRLLRLAFHRLVTLHKVVFPSPWGILTGVRPAKIVHRLLEQGLASPLIEEVLQRDYGISPAKAQLVTDVALFQRTLLQDRETAGSTVSLYIGIPFCPSRCHYCSFPAFSLERWGRLLPRYLEVLSQEIAAVGQLLQEHRCTVQTVYIGGGTPTILSAAQLSQLLELIAQALPIKETREITLEGGRPDTMDLAKLTAAKSCGVTRLSINPQTMHDETLRAIGRNHSVAQILEIYRMARELEFPVVNMDLIIGLPGENTAMVRATIEEVSKLQPENITLHALAIKRAASYRQEPVDLPGQSSGQEMMDMAEALLQERGYRPYYLYRQKEILAHGENIGYCLPPNPCLYNIQMIEERQTIIGCGVGAGSKIINPADWSLENSYNPKDLEVYIARGEEIIRRKVDKLLSFVYNNSHT